MLRDYTSATELHKRALNIRQKVLGADQDNTATSYFNLGTTQCMLRDYTSATESHKRALNIRQKVLSEDHENTADSTMMWECLNVCLTIICQPLSQTSEH